MVAFNFLEIVAIVITSLKNKVDLIHKYIIRHKMASNQGLGWKLYHIVNELQHNCDMKIGRGQYKNEAGQLA